MTLKTYFRGQGKGTGGAPRSTRPGGNVVAGGLGSRQINPQGQRLGMPARQVSPGGISQLGEAIGNHITERRGESGYRGDPFYDGPGPINAAQRLGNEVAQATKCGVGGSRNLYATGSQKGMPRTPQPIGPTRDTAAEFGPDSSIVRNRK